VKFRNIRSGTLSDQKLRSEDSLERATLDEREMQYLYKDGDSFHFMDTSTYEQMHIDAEALGESVNYIIPDALITVEFYGSEPVGIELPQTVDLVVEETAPGIKGATASNQIKPARLETGLVVNVPPFVNTGDKVRVNTETGEYLSRA
jgi:elongation factor P